MREIFLAKLAIEKDWKAGAEIGVWYGRTFFHLLDSKPDLVLYGVDIWKFNPKNIHHCDQDLNKCEVLDKVKTYGGRGIILNMPSLEAAIQIADNSLDFVFIDADHSFEAVKADITAWIPKVKTGGYLTGHDWDWLSVKEAVITTIPDVTPGIPANDFVWVWRKQ